MREIIFVPGAGESRTSRCVPYQLCKPWLRASDRKVILSYNNGIGPVGAKDQLNPLTWRGSLKRNVDQGVQMLARYVALTPHIPILVGYSMGAYVVNEFLVRRNRGEFRDLMIDEAILIANPRAPRRYSLAAGGVTVEGIAGHDPRGLGVPITEILNPKDVICSCPVASELRLIPDAMEAFIGGDVRFDWLGAVPTAITRWAVAGNKIASLADTEQRLINGYLNQSEHVHRYFNDPSLSRMPAAVLG